MASPNYQEGYLEDQTRGDDNEEVRRKPDPFQRILAKLDDLENGMQSIHSRVQDLEAQRAPTESRDLEPSAKVQRTSEVRNATPRVQTSQREVAPPVASSAESQDAQQRLWADEPLEVSMDYEAEIIWEQEAEDDTPDAKGIKLFKVDDRTDKFLAGHFSNAVPNQTRRQWRDKYNGAPNTSATACPNMDKVVKTRLSAVTKSQDKQLAKQQALFLDAVGPITYLLEEATKGELTQKKAVEAAQTALKLLGNASAHANRERRRNALQAMNPRLVDMADDDSIYKTAAPALFGDGFCKKAKERDEELRCLNQATSSKTGFSQSKGNNFFRGGRSYKYKSQQHPRGIGQDTRGRKRGSFQRSYPYSKPLRPLEESKKP